LHADVWCEIEPKSSRAAQLQLESQKVARIPK
jgi:hypothetical protein